MTRITKAIATGTATATATISPVLSDPPLAFDPPTKTPMSVRMHAREPGGGNVHQDKAKRTRVVGETGLETREGEHQL